MRLIDLSLATTGHATCTIIQSGSSGEYVEETGMGILARRAVDSLEGIRRRRRHGEQNEACPD